MMHTTLLGIVVCCEYFVAASPSAERIYSSKSPLISGDLIFHPDHTFDIDIVLRGCKISVDGLTFSSPVPVPDMVMMYKMLISYNGTSLTNAVESCSNTKIKISDFDVPLTGYFFKGYNTWEDIYTFWGETPGNFVYRRRRFLDQIYLLLATGSMLDTLFCSAATKPSTAQGRLAPSPEDIPPGMYVPCSVPPELETINLAGLQFKYPTGSALVRVSYAGADTSTWHSFYQLRPSMMGVGDSQELGIAKCYFFLPPLPIKLWRASAFEGVTRWNEDHGNAILCTRSTSTRSKPELTLYLDAVHGGRRTYRELNLPVDLMVEGTHRSDQAWTSFREAYMTDDNPFNEWPWASPVTGEQNVKDGTYFNELSILYLETRSDGRQRATFTSWVDKWKFGTLENILVLHDENCSKLEGLDIRICQLDDDQLLVKGYGHEDTLLYFSSDAFQSS
ncbi:hypothetical protein FOZ63_001957 [Perkinsus olseni]|uniref:Uncharacterized protein n=1 Tax=Perkinsus olseni TaxID=32597 RepID=A0A7J6S4A0_PEROL|nr:hypothetical protein FOZ63_001957 [Perkinsus olseni]